MQFYYIDSSELMIVTGFLQTFFTLVPVDEPAANRHIHFAMYVIHKANSLGQRV